LHWSAKFILLVYSFRAKFILRVISVQNLFCESLECKIYFAGYWSAKFILRVIGVQNFLHSNQTIGTKSDSQNKFCTPIKQSDSQNKFCTPIKQSDSQNNMHSNQAKRLAK